MYPPMGLRESPRRRSWQVLLLGGASGSGKTRVSYRLARHFNVGITEVDDFQIVLEQMTTPEGQPILHQCWHPDANRLPAERILELQIAAGETMTPALEAVVANHIETQTPIVLEGDYILPSLASRCRQRFGPKQVRAVFLYEPDETQLRRNFAGRKLPTEEQIKRARVSFLYGRWLKEGAESQGDLVVEARPWESVLDRILDVVA